VGEETAYGQIAHARRGAEDCGEYRQAAGAVAMSERLQLIIVMASGAFALVAVFSPRS
jgi:hypothetical protein